MVVIAAAVADREKRNQHGTYDLKVNTEHMGVYTRKNREIKCRKRGGGEWVELGGNVGAGYFPPHWDQPRVSRVLRGMLGQVDTIMGDFNCCGGSKKKSLEEVVAEFDLDDIGTTQHTHEWGQHKERIDRVLTKARARPWVVKEGWGCLSDYAAIEARVKLKDGEAVSLPQTNWRKVEEYIDREKEKIQKRVGEQEHTYEYAGQAVEALVKTLSQEWTRTVNGCARSKKWWKQEFKQMGKEAAKDKGNRRLLKAKIKEAKKEQWRKFVEEGEDVWTIARIAKNPFNLKNRCGSSQEEDGLVVDEYDQEGKCKAFLRHNIICGQPAPEATPRPRMKSSPLSEDTRERVRRALMKTRNHSAPGPDGVTWRLLKAIRDTRLGRAVLDDVVQMAEVGNRYYGEQEWRDMTMVMIPKAGKDHSNVKGWRPIVLLNTVGKLAAKVVAQLLGKKGELFHERAFARRKWRGAIDSVMLMDELRRETGGEVYQRDIKSAFNSLSREVMREVLAGHEDLQEYVNNFLRPREFEVKVDGRKIGQDTMVGGHPRNPRSHRHYSRCTCRRWYGKRRKS